MPSLGFHFADKIAHFSYFFIGGVILATAFFYTFRLRDWFLILTVLLILSNIGRLDERHQAKTPGRSGNDLGDWIADFAGALIGSSTVAGFYAWRRRPK